MIKLQIAYAIPILFLFGCRAEPMPRAASCSAGSSLSIRENAFFFDNQPTCEQKKYCLGVEVGCLKNGKPDGWWFQIWGDGSIKATGYAIDGLKDGCWRENHYGGTSFAIGRYSSGKRDGAWMEDLGKDGLFKSEWKAGELVSGKKVDTWSSTCQLLN